MYPDILHQIERLQTELANAGPSSRIAPVLAAVAQIAADLRSVPPAGGLISEHRPLPNGRDTPDFLQ
jgi:hypothetical protein